MDEKLKYRLVGASVILALAVFFLPMILDSEKYRSQIQSQIPQIPSEHKSQYKELENSNSNQQSETPIDGPVERGPLVINLDDTDQQQLPVSTEQTAEQSSEKQSQQIQEPVKQEPSVSSNQSTEQQSASDKPKETKPEPVAKAETESVPKTEPKTEKPSNEDVSSKPAQQDEVVAAAENESKPADESELAFSDTAWLIQIGSFSNKENATRLVAQLRDEGYRAYQRVGDSFARVYVGPYPVKGEAESRTSALEKLVGTKVKVIEFDPKQH